MSQRKGPFRLVTVNTAPERAKKLIGRLIEALKEDYDIEHVDNCESELILGSGSRDHSPSSAARIVTY